MQSALLLHNVVELPATLATPPAPARCHRQGARRFAGLSRLPEYRRLPIRARHDHAAAEWSWSAGGWAGCRRDGLDQCRVSKSHNRPDPPAARTERFFAPEPAPVIV